MKVSVKEAIKKLDASAGAMFSQLMRHGNMSAEIYRPVGTDVQTPHLQDEIYIIISGTGNFTNNGEQTTFAPGDLLFVRAGAEHRFSNFTDDFATWVIFYGPLGGEKPVESGAKKALFKQNS